MLELASRPVLVVIVLLLVLFAILPMMQNAPDIYIPSKVPDTAIYALAADSTLATDIEISVSHANMRHGVEADMARECSGRSEQKFFNPQTKRTAYMCMVEGFFGFHILDEAGNEVTAFLKNKMKSFDQVLRYMQNAGYELLH